MVKSNARLRLGDIAKEAGELTEQRSLIEGGQIWDQRFNFQHPKFRVVTRVETIQKLESDFRQKNTVARNVVFEPQLRWQDSVDEFEKAKGLLPDIVNETGAQSRLESSPGRMKVVESVPTNL